MKNLIIVESPTKARTLSRFLGSDFMIEATMGHIRDLPERKIGIKADNDFAPDYVILPKKEETVEKLKTLAKKADKIYLATDPDREGEAIAWHVGEILKGSKSRKSRKGEKSTSSTSPTHSTLSRIVFHEITESAIKHALEKPREIDMDLVNAQQARRILDRIVGYKLSPLLWFKIRRGLSAGRVQTVAVRLIVDREREIEKFVRVEYWEIFCDFKKRLGSNLPDAPVFQVKLTKKNGETFKISKQDEADEAVAELKDASFEISEIIRKESKRSPLPPFTTSTLQQQAANRIGWSSKRTMQVAQKLYEQGLITYHRTDSTNIAQEAIIAARAFIQKEYGQEFLPTSPRIYKTKSKVAQEAHEAIRPTDFGVRVGSGTWEKDEERLYDLIWKRFVACQMSEAIFDETKILVLAAGVTNYYLLEATGRIIKFAGWMKLYEIKENQEDKDAHESSFAEASTSAKASADESEDKDEGRLPELEKGDELNLIKIDPLQKFTQPPARYNEASLIKIMEEYGIGRPSTYAPTISTIQDRQYVEKTDGRFTPTALGFAVNDFLVEYFSDIFDFTFTAQMEDDLDEIANGKKEWVPVIRAFYEPFNTKLTSVSKVAERVTVEAEVTDENCPECGAPLVIRIGRFGKFLSCSKFPECKFTKPYLKDAGFKCQKCGAPVVLKKTKKGKTFYGCSTWPKCDFATWRKPK
ncbi:MAG: type I DNA topoisomerase [bacterium]|nr:type I DNA topoisomerase [bacterium]